MRDREEKRDRGRERSFIIIIKDALRLMRKQAQRKNVGRDRRKGKLPK